MLKSKYRDGSVLLQVLQAKSLNISHDCDSCYLGFLLQGDQLEESEGSSELLLLLM